MDGVACAAATASKDDAASGEMIVVRTAGAGMRIKGEDDVTSDDEEDMDSVGDGVSVGKDTAEDAIEASAAEDAEPEGIIGQGIDEGVDVASALVSMMLEVIDAN